MKMSLRAFTAAAIAIAASIALTPLAFAAQVAATAPLELRSGPGPDYDVVGSLAAGTVVNVLWCGTKQSWCLIKHHGTQGWVSMSALKVGGPNAAPTDGSAVFPSAPGGKKVVGSPAGLERETVADAPSHPSLTGDGGGTVPGSTIGGLSGLGGNMTPTTGGTIHVLGH
jgi:hypothetical protein